MKPLVIPIADDRGCTIRIVNYSDDPTSWIVRVWRGSTFLRKPQDSFWFNTREQAEAYARALRKTCARQSA